MLDYGCWNASLQQPFNIGLLILSLHESFVTAWLVYDTKLAHWLI